MSYAARYCQQLTDAVRPLLAADPAQAVRDAAASVAYSADLADLVGAARAAAETLRHLDDAAATIERARETLAATLRDAMAETGLTSVRVPGGIWYLRDPAPRVIVTDENALPPEYLMQPPQRPNFAEIRAALRTGRHVPGAVLSNGGEATLCYRATHGDGP
jgi:hypothetical protein